MPRFEPVDHVEVTIVMDNTVDVLMANTPVAHRFQVWNSIEERPTPRAEHGFCAWIEIHQGGQRFVALLDSGVTPTGILNNMDAFGLKPQEIQALILSHGHNDHAAGLPALLDRLGPGPIPLVLHPDATLDRKLVLPNGVEFPLKTIQPEELRRENIEWMVSSGPTLLADGRLLVSGEIPRQTDFEQGLSIHYANRGGEWQPDPFIRDDQCAILNVRGKGLVIITGCGHAGIINIIQQAQALTGVREICAVIGGFHLTGGSFEQAIPATVAALKDFQPGTIVPCHCTGFSAIHQIASAMPKALVPSSVGTTFVFTAEETHQ